jgi:hypothetical protein
VALALDEPDMATESAHNPELSAVFDSPPDALTVDVSETTTATPLWIPQLVSLATPPVAATVDAPAMVMPDVI